MDELKAKYLEQIAYAADEAALEAIRVAAVGKKGEVSLQMRQLGKMTPEERQVAGPALNALKDEIMPPSRQEAALADAALDERLKSEWLDVAAHRARREERFTRSARPKRSLRSLPRWGFPWLKGRA